MLELLSGFRRFPPQVDEGNEKLEEVALIRKKGMTDRLFKLRRLHFLFIISPKGKSLLPRSENEVRGLTHRIQRLQFRIITIEE